jgi:hypothetical protein
MESKFKKIRKQWGILIALAIIALGYSHKTAIGTYVPSHYRQELPPCQSGDLIFRFGDGRWSRFFRDVSSDDKRFSHVGIVVADQLGVAVIHSSADDSKGIGSVRRDTLSNFIGDYDDVAIFRLNVDEGTRREVASAAITYIGKPFDAKFELSTVDSVYCTELIRLVVNKALGRIVVGTTQIMDLEIVALDDCYRGSWLTKVYDKKQIDMPNNTVALFRSEQTANSLH